MNTLVYLWRGTPTTTDYAILDTPMHPARFYFGPVAHRGLLSEGRWVGLDNATSRYHRTLDEAKVAAAWAGFNPASAVTANLNTELVADFIFAHTRADRTEVYVKALHLLGEEAKDQWTTADVVDAILRAAKVVPRDPTDSHP